MRSLGVLLTMLSASLAGEYDTLLTVPGRDVVVHLFEWKWPDIADECERFLQHYGVGAVQVSPPNEHIIKKEASANDIHNHPWWLRYQPISYKLESRSGTRAQFIDMVDRCNAVGVRIIVDAVINHMAGVGVKKGVNAESSGGSDFDTTNNSRYFPGVPYTLSKYFNDDKCASECPANCDIGDYNNAIQVRNCRLVGLTDLDQNETYVRNATATFLNDLTSIGVAGFRVDAVKHMWPSDLNILYGQLANLRSDIFGANKRPFIVNEIIDYSGTEAIKGSDYLVGGSSSHDVGRLTNFAYGKNLYDKMKNNPDRDVGNLETLGSNWFFGWQSHQSMVFVDNHDSQREPSNKLHSINYHSGKEYVQATAFMLGWDYGVPRLMSGYAFEQNDRDKGPPADANNHYDTLSPTFNADGSCVYVAANNDGWVCEHRWDVIRRMAALREASTGQALTNKMTRDGPNCPGSNCNKGIAFSRGNKAFVAINSGDDWSGSAFHTNLPSGTYCDVISGELSADRSACTGDSVVVDANGYAALNVKAVHGVLALHVGQMVNDKEAPASPPTTGFQRTVIMMKKTTQSGEDIFFRGGGPNDAAISIAHKTFIPQDKYNAWRVGDSELSWGGAEGGQGSHNNAAAEGTPAAWTTDDASNTGAWSYYNRHGDHYWLVELDMDCGDTNNGWFQLKGFQKGGAGCGGGCWESLSSQQSSCGGKYGAFPSPAPYPGSWNHVARCGALNVFEYGQPACAIHPLP